MSNTSLSDLRVYEAGAGPASEPILKAGEVQLDVGAVGAARGKDPTEIHFRDAQVLLRFDRNGDLLTRLPPGRRRRRRCRPSTSSPAR